MVAWELTRNCNLNCVHCRASAKAGPHKGELTTDECKKVVDEILAFSSPTVILTGGEPLMREDIFEIIDYANEKGLRTVMATNGTLLDREKTTRLIKGGIKRVSMSIDGKNREDHDSFRGVVGSFDAVIKATHSLSELGLPFQINTTVTRLNVTDLEAIYTLVKSVGAVAWHVFLLVPVGRGERLKGEELSAETYEDVLEWLYETEKRAQIEMKVTCAPHYYRIVKQKGDTPKSSGCLAGKTFMFISHKGVIQPCGYLEVPSGDLSKTALQKIWEESTVFTALRDLTSYKGKCAGCRFLKICGGCRARAHEKSGDILAEEPLCSYYPTGGAG